MSRLPRISIPCHLCLITHSLIRPFPFLCIILCRGDFTQPTPALLTQIHGWPRASFSIAPVKLPGFRLLNVLTHWTLAGKSCIWYLISGICWTETWYSWSRWNPRWRQVAAYLVIYQSHSCPSEMVRTQHTSAVTLSLCLPPARLKHSENVWVICRYSNSQTAYHRSPNAPCYELFMSHFTVSIPLSYALLSDAAKQVLTN